jgi:hypothetical protein
MRAGRALDGFDGISTAYDARYVIVVVVPIIANAITAIPHTIRYCFMTFLK